MLKTPVFVYAAPATTNADTPTHARLCNDVATTLPWNYCGISWVFCKHRSGCCLLHTHLLSWRTHAAPWRGWCFKGYIQKLLEGRRGFVAYVVRGRKQTRVQSRFLRLVLVINSITFHCKFLRLASNTILDRCCFYYSIKKSQIALLEAPFARIFEIWVCCHVFFGLF